MAPLSFAVVLLHCGKTACAAAMAVRVSPAFILGTVATTLPVAGLSTWWWGCCGGGGSERRRKKQGDKGKTQVEGAEGWGGSAVCCVPVPGHSVHSGIQETPKVCWMSTLFHQSRTTHAGVVRHVTQPLDRMQTTHPPTTAWDSMRCTAATPSCTPTTHIKRCAV